MLQTVAWNQWQLWIIFGLHALYYAAVETIRKAWHLRLKPLVTLTGTSQKVEKCFQDVIDYINL